MFDINRYIESTMTKPAAKARPIAADIYERQEMNAEGLGGSVAHDIAGLSFAELEDYFGDTDPSEYL